MSADLQNPIFNDETAAREALEAVRWPRGPTCPHCGNADQEKIAKVEGKKQSHRPGLHYCNECKGQFTATVGTVFESSKVPLTKWWLASHLMGSSKKGMSAHQMHRMLGVTYKTAWFMAHRIREAMRDDFGPANPLGGKGKTVEIDETYHGNVKVPRPRNKYLPPPTKGGKVGPAGKRAVLALVERQGKRSGRNRGVYPTVREQTRDAREQTVLAREQTEIARKQLADKTLEQVLDALKDMRAHETWIVKTKQGDNNQPSAAPAQSSPPTEARSVNLGAQKKPKARHVRRKADKQRRRDFCGRH